MRLLLLVLSIYVVLAMTEDMPPENEEEEEIYEVPKLDVIGSFSLMLKVLSYIGHTISNLGSGLGNLLHSFSHTEEYPHHLVHEYDVPVNTTPHLQVGMEPNTTQNATVETTPITPTTIHPDSDPTDETANTISSHLDINF